ncbi:hypothetical protein N7499_003275 [Penicillium canescens]|uniref:Altered inheritance of mitochondria protein 9, mitochondrial n=1 Tax=Penicillium canescens TaxID=5083 RepID=A0AAD6N631_PENCN|nr:uncharacterized protein N7446_014042 [Penicillium canescens]KAJ6018526.1 hypothetical protein N7522_001990 [Penicillium canescens]KAJ6034132.1 hypothetical protein N7460_009949 [Penicillium canescens]KAJ6039294.1 hypothetical protein N7446_014042 [Penicillium canescens]KAJ6066137.1 hypothetical protein N7444_000266 [Penicillium canescens]KAJ6091124.1 hypothetical protein N7499_003275 [Penicillium canescens]
MLRALRNFTTHRYGRPGSSLSITCRGASITQEELFAYTNGHFLANEEYQLNRRYVRFDVDELCNTTATVGGKFSQVTAIDKMEGGFSKAFLMRKENGSEVIAKIPCHIAGPPTLTTAGEVGALEYIRKHTSIPVPRVLAWSSNNSNAVGAEYIIMEKAAGVPLFQVWGSMAEFDQLQLIRNLTQIEAQLSAIHFPAYGGLYLRTDIEQPNKPLDDELDPSFCIGPSCDRGYNPDPSLDFDKGPWYSISTLGVSIAKREMLRISKNGQQDQALFYKGDIEEQTELLQATESVMELLDSNEILKGEASQPILWHTDLHMGNIFVASDECSRIVSLIDLQSISVLPAFLQAQWPVFLKPPQNYDYEKGIFEVKLRDDFDTLDEDGKMLAMREWSQVKLAKAYEISTLLEDKPAHRAMNVPRVFRELFLRCGEVSEIGVLPLRACLIELFQNWSDLGFSGECPLSFTQEQVDTHDRQFSEYQAWYKIQALAQECLDTDAEGWVAPGLDVNEKRTQNEELLTMYIESVAGQKSAEEARAIWPFPVKAGV